MSRLSKERWFPRLMKRSENFEQESKIRTLREIQVKTYQVLKFDEETKEYIKSYSLTTWLLAPMIYDVPERGSQGK